METHLRKLIQSPRIRFADFDKEAVPIGAGVYLIWEGSKLIYIGMSVRGATPDDIASAKRVGKPKWLRQRLAAHASGRLSGDQFCVYVANRLVLKGLTAEQIARISSGALSLDVLVRDYISGNLSYSYREVRSGSEALALEASLRSGTTELGYPLLNPAK